MSEADSYYRSEAEKLFQDAYKKQSEGMIEEAIGLYTQSIDLFPTAEAHTFLGWAYSFKRDYDRAIQECRRAIEIDPDFGNPYNDIGSYMIEEGKLDDAIPWLEKAAQAKRYESYCFPHYNLGRIWERKGDWTKALKSYRQSFEANRDYSLAKKAISRLQGLMN